MIAVGEYTPSNIDEAIDDSDDGDDRGIFIISDYYSSEGVIVLAEEDTDLSAVRIKRTGTQ